MAVETECQTPGARFDTHIHETGFTVDFVYPGVLDLSEDQAELLDANIHNALELVLAPYFKE